MAKENVLIYLERRKKQHWKFQISYQRFQLTACTKSFLGLICRERVGSIKINMLFPHLLYHWYINHEEFYFQKIYTIAENNMLDKQLSSVWFCMLDPKII